MLPSISIVFLHLYLLSGTNSIGCIDDDGHAVEWYVGYKFPNSFNYAFLTTQSSSWTNSTHEIGEGGMMKNTYDAMYGLLGHKDAVYGVYNDEKSNLSLTQMWWGHMKGAFAFEYPNTGFWIIHSIPKLSEAQNAYRYPATGKMYGQHFFCVSLSSDHLKLLVDQLGIARPFVQDFYIAPSVDKLYPDLSSLFNHRSTTHDLSGVQSFRSTDGGLNMKHFVKSSQFTKDLYADLVVNNLGLSLEVESWRHGDNEPSMCEPHKPSVFNIISLNFSTLHVDFSSYSDHAKWAVTSPSQSGSMRPNMWVCLGDINRQYPQFHRGGGTMCVRHEGLWKAFSSIISHVEPCKSSCSAAHPIHP